MIPRAWHVLAAFAAASAVSFCPEVKAQAPYPTKPIQVIVTVSAGGSIDTIARARRGAGEEPRPAAPAP